ncbi:CDP-glycerol glycerophosphotransferase family protein [Pediococcus pentosaceus]|uniref:CDP-glycerol glycerophosphotransferase family protein n=1 Tax=Pediococcus pentosaceus TaxID=1255 RepID=UPI0011B83DC4|nr:CDP-glycerol glycerophosphotransferase family protein [Pediococcus pentosaceus]MEB3376386.1 CDP-glycerol glycerophosphotransferase family protein [Pediococcus pentosaceus]QDZ69681.1 teichoic acid biosynthesis protein [Pediococcus pentosaceus]
MNFKQNIFFRTSFQAFFSTLNKIVRKKKDRIVLYSNWGFRDNVEYLFKFLVNNNYNERYEIICASNDFLGLEKKHYKNTKFVSNKIHILYYFLSSKYFFYCFGGLPITPAKEQIVVNLWHGMPIKKVGLLETNATHKRLNYFSYILSYSDFFSDIIKKSFDVDDSKILVANAPRNEALLVPENKNSKKKYIVWMPTYRSSKQLNSINGSENEILPLIKSESELQIIDELLNRNDEVLFVKLHPLQDYTHFSKNYENIRFIDDKWLKTNQTGLYEFLAESEALITDYSSISIDYVLLNKPIFYILDDIELYKKNRGLNFTLEQFIAGNIINDFNEFSNIFLEKDNFKALRKDKEELFYDNKYHGSKYILNIVGIV